MFSASSTHKASAPPSPKVIRLPPAPTTQSTEKWAPKDGQMFYSTSRLGKRPNSGTIEYFIGPDGNPNCLPDRHIHVIHNEKRKTVTLRVTDRTQSGDEHFERLVLDDDPPGNDVNKAIQKMLVKLNDRSPGPNTVQWPEPSARRRFSPGS